MPWDSRPQGKHRGAALPLQSHYRSPVTMGRDRRGVEYCGGPDATGARRIGGGRGGRCRRGSGRDARARGPGSAEAVAVAARRQ